MPAWILDLDAVCDRYDPEALRGGGVHTIAH